MGSKKDLRAELEVLRKELSSTQLKLSFSQSAVDHWVGAAAAKQDRMTELEAELRTEKAKPKFIGNTIIGDRADKKIIDNQKQAILELHKQVDVLADQRNNAIDRAERAEAKSDGWSDAYTNQVGALHEQCDQLRDELAELKAKQSPFALAIPESYKLRAKDQEIRELNLYITRLTNQLDNIRLAAR